MHKTSIRPMRRGTRGRNGRREGRRRGDGATDSGASAKGSGKAKEVAFVDESYKIRIERLVKSFNEDDSRQSHTFDAGLSKDERKYVHELCKLYGLLSKSRGKGANRQLTISKKSVQTSVTAVSFDLCQRSKALLSKYFTEYPPRPSDYEKPSYSTYHTAAPTNSSVEIYSAVGKEGSFSRYDERLPIVEVKQELLAAIGRAEVVVVTGETGCGKSTQVPQYILGQDVANRVICTQPRRLSAVSLADRVAEESGSNLGEEVGYSIRLEKKFTKLTRLLFCTTGVLLRNLTLAGELSLAGITHVIIDEVHERDCNSDFLLILLREMLRSSRGAFKVILMSATVKVEDFTRYFEEFVCEHVHAQGKTFPVQHVFLEDILKRTNYVESIKQQYPYFKSQLESIVDMEEDILEAGEELGDTKVLEIDGAAGYKCISCGMDGMSAAEFGQHAAVCRGHLVEDAVKFTCEWTEAEDEELETQLDTAVKTEESSLIEEESSQDKSSQLAVLLKQYQYSRQLRRLDDDLTMDVSLVLSVLEYIHELRDDLSSFGFNESSNSTGGGRGRARFKGAVLVFVSGWSDIVLLQERLESHHIFGNAKQCAIHCLHSAVATKNQRRVFDRAPQGIRKIIIATNIAETSLTINDVVYVVDVGHHKEKDYDSRTKVSSLVVKYISKANAAQRSGRAGRCQNGVCFRLYSRDRHEAFQEDIVPEMCRCSLEELCLQTSIILSRPPSSGLSLEHNSTIPEFLNLALSKPEPLAVANAVELLQLLGALDATGIITYLGVTMARLPVSPSLAKALIVGCQLGCEEDILLLCAFTMSPFTIAQTSELEQKQLKAKERWSGSWSDQLGLINLYKEWKASSNKHQFCKAVCVSSGVMNTVDKMVSHLRFSVESLMARKKRFEAFPKRGASPLTFLSLCGISCAPNIALSLQGVKTFTAGKERGIKLHRDCSLKASPEKVDFVVFEEISRSKALCTIRNCSFILPICLVLLVATKVEIEIKQAEDESEDNADYAFVRIGDGICLRAERSLAQCLQILRTRFEQLFDTTVASRARVNSEEVATVELIHSLLWEESRANASELSGVVQGLDSRSRNSTQPVYQHRRNGLQTNGRRGRGGPRGRGRGRDARASGGRGRGRGRGIGYNSRGRRGNFRGGGRGRH